MWYDSFLSQFENFLDVFKGGNLYWGDIINGTIIAVLLFVIFTIAAVVALIVNGTACSDIKLVRTFRNLKMFTARFGVIQKGNFTHFNKMCLSKMPGQVKRACIKYIFYPNTQTQTNLKRTLIRVSDRSCSNGFIGYLSVYGVGAILAIVTIALETFYLESNNLYLAISLFYGASVLIVMALQMYYIANKYKNIDIQIYTEIISRYIDDGKAEAIEEKLANKSENKAIDSIDELRRVVYGLIESGASKELLGMFKDGLLSIASTNYNSTADQLRLENIVSRINNYIV